MTRYRKYPALFGVLLLFSLCINAAERVALLPFSNPSATESVRLLMDQNARVRLAKCGFDVVSADSINQVLRSLRVRNTAAPIESEIRALAESLDVALVLTGTIHRFVHDSTFSEASVCARLLRAEDSAVLWQNCATVYGGGAFALFSQPVHDSPSRLASSAAKQLFASATPAGKSSRHPVKSIVVKGRDKKVETRCASIAIIPPVDEAEAIFAGDMLGDFLHSVMARRGFNVLDPGRVRNIMLYCEDLRHGQSVDVVSQALADSLNVDLVVTGTVSTLTSTRTVSLGSSPEAAIELRMIDPRQNTVVWAKNLRRSGDSNRGLFESGVVRSPAKLAYDMIADAIAGLRVVRLKNIELLKQYDK